MPNSPANCGAIAEQVRLTPAVGVAALATILLGAIGCEHWGPAEVPRKEDFVGRWVGGRTPIPSWLKADGLPDTPHVLLLNEDGTCDITGVLWNPIYQSQGSWCYCGPGEWRLTEFEVELRFVHDGVHTYYPLYIRGWRPPYTLFANWEANTGTGVVYRRCVGP
jgi:hypothetical protein